MHLPAGRPEAGAHWSALAALATLSAALLIQGCAVAPPPQRHSPAQIAAYRPAQFSTEIASAQGAGRQRELAMATIARAQAGDADDATLTDALRAIAFYDTQRETGQRLVRAALADPQRPFTQRPVEQQRAILTAAYTLDALGSAPLIAGWFEQLATPREFAIAAYILREADPGADRRRELRAALQRRSDQDDPRLRALAQMLDDDEVGFRPARPPLSDLLAAKLTPGLPVVFSLQRHDRRYAGLALVRDVDGRFVRGADGGLFAVPHLALSLSGLPGTITLGNTPQGLFTIVGAGTADNPWIGPTPFLESKVPVEASVSEFAHAPTTGEWSQALYEAWLPPSWRGYAPIDEAWLAGLAGRDEMLVHGTAVDPTPYRLQSYYPGTPSDGCLVAFETWSPDGRLQRSDQLALAQAFTRSGIGVGYLVVVEIDDGHTPVSLAEVLPEVLAAETRRLGQN